MKTKCLLYCTKAKPYLSYSRDSFGKYYLSDEYHYIDEYLCSNGKISAECEVECEEIDIYTNRIYETKTLNQLELLEKSCLTHCELFEYLGEDYSKKGGYALHISNLKAFDKPLELSEVEHKVSVDIGNGVLVDNYLPLKKAPQNMCRVWYKGQMYILISIRPQWYCKIVNGEKTIEIRKQVLNCMKGE